MTAEVPEPQPNLSADATPALTPDVVLRLAFGEHNFLAQLGEVDRREIHIETTVMEVREGEALVEVFAALNPDMDPCGSVDGEDFTEESEGVTYRYRILVDGPGLKVAEASLGQR